MSYPAGCEINTLDQFSQLWEEILPMQYAGDEGAQGISVTSLPS